MAAIETVVSLINIGLNRGQTLGDISRNIGVDVEDMECKLLEGGYKLLEGILCPIEPIEPIEQKEAIESLSELLKAIELPCAVDKDYRASMRVNDTVSNMFTRFCNTDGRYPKKDQVSRAMFLLMLLCEYEEAMVRYKGGNLGNMKKQVSDFVSIL